MTTLVPHERLLQFKSQFRRNDFKVLHDRDAGTLEVTDEDGIICLKAIQKSRRGPWITTFTESKNVQWKHHTHGDIPSNASSERRDVPEVP